VLCISGQVCNQVEFKSQFAPPGSGGGEALARASEPETLCSREKMFEHVVEDAFGGSVERRHIEMGEGLQIDDG
jgi:hypothetical protein